MMKIAHRLTLAVPLSLAAFALTPVAAQAPAGTTTAASTKPAHASAQRSFASPEEAVKSLVDALRKADMKALVALGGPGSQAWINSGDAVQDAQDRQFFLAAYDAKNVLEANGADRFILAVGADAWPSAVPIVNMGGRWVFDAKAGREEVANRHIGRNELDTIRTLLEVVEAQRKYAAADPDGNGIADYARRFISSERKKDGLYWTASPVQAASPLEALAALAAAQGYSRTASAAPQAFHGYHYRLLTAQGKDAPGGARDYLVKGQLTEGFAVVAYPAKYGASGFMTFIVNQDGVVYEKNLGSASTAASITLYNPDATWRKAQR
jgi:hypothetical protein